MLINQGRSLYEVQRILGHTQIKTTQRYAHLSNATLLAAVNAASSEFMLGASEKISTIGIIETEDVQTIDNDTITTKTSR